MEQSYNDLMRSHLAEISDVFTAEKSTHNHAGDGGPDKQRHEQRFEATRGERLCRPLL